MPLRKPHTWLFAALLIYFLYFFHLTAAGMLGPDEPRYASIGREMARSGDWITPRLWGEPWFEKPPLLYWMTAAAFRLGLRDELAPRLPVALVSVAFLAFFFWIVRRDFGERIAWFAALILATSAGWIGMSQAAVTDIPLAAAFSAAVLLSLRWVQKGERAQLPYAAALLGAAVLAKGLVAPALFLPVLWFGRRRLLDLLRPSVLGVFLLVAAPWYIACFVRNGWPFLNVFIWQHHVERVFSPALQHGQPFWFYLPVFLAAIFPWTPILPFTLRPDVRRAGSVLLVIVAFGLVVFSIPLNKLAEYLLPLLPSTTLLLALALAGLSDRVASWCLVLCAAFAGMAPLLAAILPDAVARGLTRSHPVSMNWLFPAQVILCLLVKLLRPSVAAAVVAGIVTAAVIYLKIVSLPLLDQAATARPIWREVSSRSDQVCVEQMHRAWRYGLNYYSVTPLPGCDSVPKPLHIVQDDARPPLLQPHLP